MDAARRLLNTINDDAVGRRVTTVLGYRPDVAGPFAWLADKVEEGSIIRVPRGRAQMLEEGCRHVAGKSMQVVRSPQDTKVGAVIVTSVNSTIFFWCGLASVVVFLYKGGKINVRHIIATGAQHDGWIG